MYIKKWLSFLQANNDEDKSKVIKFIILWMAYNQWYNESYSEILGRLNDKNKALELSKDKKAIEVYSELKKGFVNSFKEIPSVHCLIGSRDRLWADNGIEREVLFNEQYCDLNQFLTLIYQIRCNFLHGNKENNYANIKLIVWAHESLYIFLKKLDLGIELY